MNTRTNSKLTLLLDTDTIARAKQYAAQKELSLSALVETFFTQLTSEQKKVHRYSPIVESLAGIIPPPQEPDDAEYLRHLEEKYE